MGLLLRNTMVHGPGHYHSQHDRDLRACSEAGGSRRQMEARTKSGPAICQQSQSGHAGNILQRFLYSDVDLPHPDSFDAGDKWRHVLSACGIVRNLPPPPGLL